MKFSRITFRSIICILCISILITGCYSYYTIPDDDYSKIDNMEDIKIVYTNGKEFVVEINDTTTVNIYGDSLVVNQGAEEKFLQMNEVEKIKENRFDLGGTITVIIVPLTFLILLIFSTSSIQL